MKKLFTLLTLALLSIGTVWAADVTASWLAPSNSMSLTGTTSNSDYLTANTATFTTTTLVAAESWSRNSTYYYVFYNASGQSLDSDGTVNANKYVEFTATVPAGTTFTPSKVQLVAIGRSTGANAYKVDFIDNTNTINVKSATKPGSGSESAVDYSFTSPSTYSAGTTLTIRVYLGINHSSSPRGVGLRDVKLIGTSTSLSGPNITTQPTSATYESGDDATALTVAATASAGELSYQWYKNTDGDVTGKEGDKIDGATSATLAAANISTASAGTTYYYCIITDSNGSATSEKATIIVSDVFTPEISYASATNTVTITYDGSGKVYYTLDNSEPTSSSTAYSFPFVLTNSSTVRAVAIKGGNASEIVFAKYKVDHSATAKAILGFGDGSQTSGVWTSTDGAYKLTSSNGSDIQYFTIFNGSDGFKLNHTNTYTLKISDNIKVTSIKFVGISRGDAVNDATIAFDGFTPASGTIEKGTFVKTIEFTPTSELGYGASIDITTGGNQFGGYFEIYGTEYAPSATAYDETTWDFTNWSDATKTGVKGDATNWNQYERTGSAGTNFGENGRSLAISRSNNSLSYGDPGTKVAETDGLKFTCDAYGLGLMFNLPSATISETEYTYQGSQYLWLYGNKSKINIENVTKGSIIEIGVESHNGGNARYVQLNNATQTQGATSGDAAKAYQVCKWTVTTAGTITITPSAGLHIYYISLKKAKDVTTITPANDWSTYVTTKALDFSDVAGLKAYAATAATAGKVTLEEVGAVPAGTPVMLIGTAATEYTVPVATSASEPAKNLFKAGDGTTVFDGTTYDYILYTDQKFYQIGSGSVAVGKAYLHCDSDPTSGSAPYLTLDFGGDVTGIGEIKSQKIENGQFFDLQGRKVAQPSKGLYIVNGKKVVIK